jgi:hypothetical protein
LTKLNTIKAKRRREECSTAEQTNKQQAIYDQVRKNNISTKLEIDAPDKFIIFY